MAAKRPSTRAALEEWFAAEERFSDDEQDEQDDEEGQNEEEEQEEQNTQNKQNELEIEGS